jgi:hypothetical protein
MVAPKVVQLRLLGCGPVLVCIDRERREQCPPGLAGDILAQLARRLRERGDPAEGVGVVIADRAFEAWLLAGAPELRNPRSKWRPPASFEGRLGLENRLGVVELGQMLGERYDKARHGPQLFGRLDLDTARTRSRSLDKLLRSLVG